jgi:predicted DNA-binding transcriptional regulator AlpA
MHTPAATNTAAKVRAKSRASSTAKANSKTAEDQPKPCTKIPAALANLDTLPDAALIDVALVSAWLGCSKNTVLRRVREGIMPKPIKTGPMSTRWSVGAIRAYVAGLTGTVTA